MHKKTIGAVIAVALVAFAAVPALASASPVLKDKKGTVAVNALIQATNVGNVKLTTSLGTIECQTSVLTGKVTKNNGTEIEGDIETASFTGTGSEGKCTTAFLGDIKVEPKKLPWCIKAGVGKLAKDAFNVTSGACPGGGAMEFTLNSSLAGACTYTKAAVEGTFNTGPPEALLTVSEQEFKKSAGGFLCPSSGKLDMQYTLETDNAEHEPIWIE
jgi:opacity protein-like surface antigen